MFDVLIHAADHEYGGALPIHVRLWADDSMRARNQPGQKC